MDPLVLYAGEKNVSSWSMRASLGLGATLQYHAFVPTRRLSG